MNASQSTFKLPSVITTPTALDPLESLRSPQVNQNFSQKSFPSEQDSVAGLEFNDIALDDNAYSPVALTARPGMPESYPQPQDDINATSRPRVTSLSLVPPDLSIPSKSHRKTASTTTIRSSHEGNGSLFVTRVDFQEHNGKVARASVDGQMKLQEEFARLQEKETKDHNQAESSIDWGGYQSPSQFIYHLMSLEFWGAVISGMFGSG